MKKRKTRWIAAGIVVVLIVAAVLYFQGSREPRYAEAVAQTGNLTTYYSFSGSMDVYNAVTVTAPSDATVSEIYVKQNTPVTKNARLLRLSDGSILKADIAGEVTSLHVAVNAVVKTGDTLLEIMDLSGMKATFKVDEYDVSAIALGKTAQLTVDGTGDTLEAPITGMDKRATVSGDLSYYIATVDLSGIAVPSDALPGMQITARVLNQKAENAVLLPVDVISFTRTNTPYVLMRDGKNVIQVELEVGINDGTNVQITHGLKAGDTVLYTPTSVSAFQNMTNMRQDVRNSGVMQQ